MFSFVAGPPILLMMWLIDNFTELIHLSSDDPMSLSSLIWGSLASLAVVAVRAPVVVGWWSNAYLVECRFVRRGLKRDDGCDVVVAFEFQGKSYETKFSSAIYRVELMERYETDLLVIDGRKPTRCDFVEMPLYRERFPERSDA